MGLMVGFIDSLKRSETMRHDVVIREATLRDLAAMKKIWIEFIDFHAARDHFFQRTEQGHERFGEFVAERIEKVDWNVSVAVVDDQAVGHIMGALSKHPPVFVNTRFGYVQDIAVSRRFRRRGVGTSLFGHLVRWFKAHGITRVELDAAASNDTSKGFWRKMGCEDFMVRLTKEI